MREKYFVTLEKDNYGNTTGILVSKKPIRNWHDFHLSAHGENAIHAASVIADYWKLPGTLPIMEV